MSKAKLIRLVVLSCGSLFILGCGSSGLLPLLVGGAAIAAITQSQAG